MQQRYEHCVLCSTHEFSSAFAGLFFSKNDLFGFFFHSICVHSRNEKEKPFMRRSFEQWGKTIDRTKNGFLLSYVTRCLAMGKRLIVLWFSDPTKKGVHYFFALISKQIQFAFHCHIFFRFRLRFALFVSSVQKNYCLSREIFYLCFGSMKSVQR